jgi:phosphoglucomutase/phosphomannomutase
MEGSDGMARMQRLMEKFRTDMPASLAGLKVASMRDYSVGKRLFASGGNEPITGPTGNLVVLETEINGNYVAARPSGTEPKVKFYLFSYVPASEIADIEQCKTEMAARRDGFKTDLEAFVAAV